MAPALCALLRASPWKRCSQTLAAGRCTLRDRLQLAQTQLPRRAGSSPAPTTPLPSHAPVIWRLFLASWFGTTQSAPGAWLWRGSGAWIWYFLAVIRKTGRNYYRKRKSKQQKTNRKVTCIFSLPGERGKVETRRGSQACLSNRSAALAETWATRS